MKKVLSIALVLVMLLGCVTTAFAAIADAACQIEVKPTASTYKAGDVITFEVRLESNPDYLGKMGTVKKIQIGFNSAAFDYVEDVSVQPTVTSCQSAVLAGYNIENNCIPDVSFVGEGATSDLTATDTAKGWDKILHMEFSRDPGQACDDDYSNGGVAFAFKLKVKDAAAAGTYSVGVLSNANTIIDEEIGEFNEDPELATEFGIDKVLKLVDANVTVEGATSPSIIKDGGSQIRFRGIGATGTVADYKGTFDVRTVATISEEDFAAKFTDDATAIASIAEIGFIYAAKSNVAAFDVETAQNAAKTLADKEALNGYVKKTVSHIQHVEGQPYKFTCLIDNIADADKTDAVNALAYIELTTGEYIFADAAIFADYTTLYGRMPK